MPHLNSFDQLAILIKRLYITNIIVLSKNKFKQIKLKKEEELMQANSKAGNRPNVMCVRGITCGQFKKKNSTTTKNLCTNNDLNKCLKTNNLYISLIHEKE